MESHFFHHLFWGIVFSCFSNLHSEIMTDADLIPLLYNLELISIFSPNKGERTIKLSFKRSHLFLGKLLGIPGVS